MQNFGLHWWSTIFSFGFSVFCTSCPAGICHMRFCNLLVRCSTKCPWEQQFVLYFQGYRLKVVENLEFWTHLRFHDDFVHGRELCAFRFCWWLFVVQRLFLDHLATDWIQSCYYFLVTNKWLTIHVLCLHLNLRPYSCYIATELISTLGLH
jgi:hypothetical protein